MRNLVRPLAAVVLAVAVGAGFVVSSRTEAAPERSTKTAELWCKNGWRGGAGGTYGGVSFSLSCASDRQEVTIEGVSGTDYSARMGAETFTGAVDCFHTGSGAQVRESCGEVRLVIR